MREGGVLVRQEGVRGRSVSEREECEREEGVRGRSEREGRVSKGGRSVSKREEE